MQMELLESWHEFTDAGYFSQVITIETQIAQAGELDVAGVRRLPSPRVCLQEII